jgi:anti-sigma B factor antagonist
MRLKTIRADDSIHRVALFGRLDVQGVNDIQYEFLQETTVPPKSTMVDLSGVSYVASLGIGMLVSAAKHLERRGAKMVLLTPTPLVRKALETSCLHHVIPIADEETAAMELLR